MPSFRIGFGSDFSLSNQLVGIGTTTSSIKLEVDGGAIKADFDIAGVTTFTSYGGFVGQKQNVSTATTIGFNTTGIGTVGVTSFISVNEKETGFISLVGEFNTVSEDIVVDDGKILDVSTIRNIGVTTLGTQSVYVPNNTTVSVGTLEHVSIGTHFSVPKGGSSVRPREPREGMVRFNDDLNTLEFYNGVEWRQFTVTGASGRGVIGGGYDGSSNLSTIDFINITTTGNATSFGVLTASRRGVGNASSSLRGLFAAGLAPTSSNIIDYITIASEGNAIDFGDITRLTQQIGGCSSSTRGLFGGGYTPAPTSADTNIIDYVQISTIGNALDFGDLTVRRRRVGCLSSSTRGVWAGGIQDPTATSISGNVIDCITISSTGNAINFGNLTESRYSTSGLSNSTRGIFGGSGIPGSPADSSRNTIDYITISSTGNATDFGDLTAGRLAPTSTANTIRGVFAGGYLIAPNTRVNIIDFITIMTTGNAQDFGDLTIGREQSGMVSDSHGGLGGF